jgi:ArsR family transcriptional regulator, cadmium/lead-responsive transcriptional repressor
MGRLCRGHETPLMRSNLPVAASKAELDRPEVLATFFQALADPTRVRILELLAEGPMTVSDLVDTLGLAQGRVSSHLTCLRWCGYVRAEVDGRFNRYTLVDDRIRQIVKLGESIVIDNADRLTSCLVLATEGRS